MPDECPFCKIASGRQDAEVVYEDGDSMAFLDINPVAPGHTVVIPRDHAPTIFDLDDQAIASVFSAVDRVMGYIDRALDPDGFNYGVNHGGAAGQAIPHLHVHVLPRFEGDEGGSMHAVVRNPPKEQTIEEIGGLIREAAESEPSVPETPEKKDEEMEEMADQAEEELKEEKESEEEEQEAEEEEEAESEIEETLKELNEEMEEYEKKLKKLKRP